jgi:hypothetical protein
MIQQGLTVNFESATRNECRNVGKKSFRKQSLGRSRRQKDDTQLSKKKLFVYFNYSSLDDALSISNDSMAVNDELETIWVKVYVTRFKVLFRE